MNVPSFAWITDRQATSATAAGLFKVAYIYYSWRFGLEADFINLSYKYRGHEFYVFNGNIMQSYTPFITYKLGNPAIPVKLFADY